ncbi:hypothetical protein KEM55_005245, partial [Ascosphaera atra]
IADSPTIAIATMSTTSKHFRIISHIAPAQHIREYPHATASPDDTLHIALKQYIPLNNPHPRPGDVTIIGATGNAIPKEAYEPLWEELLVKSEGKFRIRSIWVADMASQGLSGRINEEVLGNDRKHELAPWFSISVEDEVLTCLASTNDHARDLLHFINMKRHEMPLPIVGVGHSMGGHHIVHLALMHARLMHTIVCIEPMIVRRLTWSKCDAENDKRTFYNMAFTAASSVRKDTWPSREKAAESLRRNPFFKAWDQRAFDKYVQYGLRETSPSPRQGGEKAVTLTTTRHQEAFMFARPAYNLPPDPATAHVTHPDHVEGITASGPFYRPECSLLFAQLPFLRPSVLYVFGNKSQCYTCETLCRNENR